MGPQVDFRKGGLMSSQPEQLFDVIVIGCGQAGPAIAARSAREGLRVAIIERANFGGTCVNVGCIPTKTLVASAKAIHQARRGSEFGFAIDGLRVNWPEIRKRKDRILMSSRNGVENWMRGQKNIEVILGHARFSGPTTVEVGERRLSAPRIVINVGGSPVRLDFPEVSAEHLLDNASLMEISELPDHLIILGGSYIGLEFAQIFRRFGSAVTVVERGDSILPREDEDISVAIKDVLSREGIRIIPQATVERAASEGKTVRLALKTPTGIESIEGSHILVAVGRVPNTAELNLSAAGVETDSRGFIKVSTSCQTTNACVWAVGDCNGMGAFTHTAWNDHEIVVANWFERDPRKISERTLCYALFVDPPLARVGATEKQLVAEGRPYKIAKLMMSRVGRAREFSETDGFLKVLVDPESELILGAGFFGLSADEVIHSVLLAMNAQISYKNIERAVPIHPTVSELLPTLLQGLK
jgi:pyruvate/2-oxoglutarate dehydrogenase complex dihydrolipoamide dehydrogenase (E3) component